MTRELMADLSSNNHKREPDGKPDPAFNFHEAKAAGLKIVIVKITEGLHYVNPWAAIDLTAAHEAGLVVGCYLFLDPLQSGKDQARFAIEQAGKIDVPHWCLATDSETPGGDVAKETQLCLFEMSAHQITSPLYSYPAFIEKYLPGAPYGHKLWLGDYGVSHPRRSVWAWQYTPVGSIAGIPSPVDLSWCSQAVA